jgi:pimeloyl-ACP methyl ester carboxylesterase
VANPQPLPGHDANQQGVSRQSGASEVDGLPTGKVGMGRAILIGHSMGGYITLALAEKYPERLKAFGLFHSTAFADSEEKKEARRKGIKFIQQHGSYEFFKTSTPNLFAPATKEERGHLVTEQIEAVRNVAGAALVNYYESMIKRPDRTAVLKNSQVPVLFVMGRFDNAVPLEDVLKQCHLPQLSYIELLHNSGHMGMVEETERSNKVLTEFIKTL